MSYQQHVLRILDPDLVKEKRFPEIGFPLFTLLKIRFLFPEVPCTYCACTNRWQCWSLPSLPIPLSRELTPIHPLYPRLGIHPIKEYNHRKKAGCPLLPVTSRRSSILWHSLPCPWRSVHVSVFPIRMCCRDCVLFCTLVTEHCLSLDSDDGDYVHIWRTTLRADICLVLTKCHTSC